MKGMIIREDAKVDKQRPKYQRNRKATEFIQVYFTAEQKETLMAHCEAQGVPASVLIRQILAEKGYFKKPLD